MSAKVLPKYITPKNIEQFDFAGHYQNLTRRVWRVVETQEIAATQAITESAKQQSRLEALLDDSKPPVPKECRELSYLLYTPFRYPPLQHGSRFGRPFERGIFYASLNRETAFAESAVYLWLFQSGPVETGALEVLSDQRTVFATRVQSRRALDLYKPAFSRIKKSIVAPGDWSISQGLGSAIRASKTDFFLYPSARVDEGVNVGVFSPEAFKDKQPEEQQHWQLRLTKKNCWFTRRGESFEFSPQQFEIDNKIPHPTLA